MLVFISLTRLIHFNIPLNTYPVVLEQSRVFPVSVPLSVIYNFCLLTHLWHRKFTCSLRYNSNVIFCIKHFTILPNTGGITFLWGPKSHLSLPFLLPVHPSFIVKYFCYSYIWIIHPSNEGYDYIFFVFHTLSYDVSYTIEVNQYIYFLNWIAKFYVIAFTSLTLTLHTLCEAAQSLKADFSKFIQFENLWKLKFFHILR